MLPVSMFRNWKYVCHLWKIKHNLLPAYTRINTRMTQINRTRELKNYTSMKSLAVIISKTVFFSENKFLVWNQIESTNGNFTNSSLTYKTMKFKFKNYFLSIFSEDPSMVTYKKRSWKQFKFI